MMHIMLIAIGVYLVACYAYGVYLLAKVYTGRRTKRRAATAGSHGFTLHASSQDSSGVSAMPIADTEDPQPDHAKAA